MVATIHILIGVPKFFCGKDSAPDRMDWEAQERCPGLAALGGHFLAEWGREQESGGKGNKTEAVEARRWGLAPKRVSYVFKSPL